MREADRATRRAGRRGLQIALAVFTASGCACGEPAPRDAVVAVATTVTSEPALVEPPTAVLVTAAGEVGARDGLRVDLVGPRDALVEHAFGEDSPGASAFALVVRIENTADEPRWLVTSVPLDERVRITLVGPNPRPTDAAEICDDVGYGAVGGAWTSIGAGERVDIPLSSLASRRPGCSAIGPHWVTAGRYRIQVTLPVVEIRSGTREASQVLDRARDLVSGTLAVDVREPS